MCLIPLDHTQTNTTVLGPLKQPVIEMLEFDSGGFVALASVVSTAPPFRHAVSFDRSILLYVTTHNTRSTEFQAATHIRMLLATVHCLHTLVCIGVYATEVYL